MATYKIIGHDQKEYGPIGVEQVQQWIAQGRLNAQSRVRIGEAADWTSLGAVPELAALLPGPANSPPPSGGAGAPAAAPKTSGLAIASLVCGVLGFFLCGISSLAGLIMGPMALSRINRSNGQLQGRGLAMGGIVVSAVTLLLVPIMAAMLLPALSKAKSRATTVQCMNHVKQLSLGFMMYANDSNDTFPAGNVWCDKLMPYVQQAQVYQCPADRSGQRSSYAFNSKVAGRSLKDIKNPSQTVLVFETSGGWNVSGGPELTGSSFRHNNAMVVGFADGHVESVNRGRLQSLRWDP